MADDILELQRAFDDAELHADTGRLATLLADDFLSIGERGFQLDRARLPARQGAVDGQAPLWIRQPDGWRLAGIQFSTLDPG